MHRAAGQNSVEVAKLLIDHGAEVSARDQQGGTPMHYAAVQNSVKTAKLLIDHGAEVSARDKKGRNAATSG